MIKKVQGIVGAHRKGISPRYWVLLINDFPEEIVF